MKKKLLSLVVTAHNEEKFIERCLRSIINSIKNQNDKIEIIVSINNSSDKTLEIANDFATKYDYIKIVESKKAGPSVARNHGIREANGEYISFIDGDDYIDDKILDVIERIEKNRDVDYFLNAYVLLKSNEVLIPKVTKNENLNKKLDLQNFARNFILNTCFSSSSSRILKTNIIKENNLFYDERFSQMEDMLFGIQILAQMHTFMFINEPYYHYEIGHESSLTKSISKERIIQGLMATQISQDFIKQNIKEKKVAKVFLQFSSLLCYSLIRRIKFLKSEDKEEIYNFFKNKNSILDYPYFPSTRLFYIFYKIFGLRFALKFV